MRFSAIKVTAATAGANPTDPRIHLIDPKKAVAQVKAQKI
jgi:hypothetical protein